VKLRLLLSSEEEFAEATLFYYERSPQVARRFKRVVEESLLAIRANPKRYRRYSKNFRVKVVRGFPYSIFYSIEPEEILVASIAHDSQAPGYWMDRLQVK
jgi:plasmid stabilization system protein ParE